MGSYAQIIENKLVVTKRERGNTGVKDWDIQTFVCKIGYKDVLHKLREYSQYFLITINGK